MGQMTHELALRTSIAFAKRVQCIDLSQVVGRPAAESRWR